MITGYRRYLKLIKNVTNPAEYFLHKRNRFKKDLEFTSQPYKIKFNVPSRLYLVFKEIFMSDVYAIDELLTKIPYNPVIVDIGSNAGYFDILILSKLPAARIYAYEPLEGNIAVLKNIISNNPSIQESILQYRYAVTGSPKEELELYVENSTDSSQVVASVFEGFNEHNKTKVTVPCITLTEIFQQHGFKHIDLLKIDCEGSEYDIIYNTDPAVIQAAKLIALEVHDIDSGKNNFESMNAYLRSLGYSTISQPINDFCFAVEATKN